MSGVASSLLALARALASGQVTPAEAADRLIILTHRVHISATQARVSPGGDGVPEPPTIEDGE